MWLSKGYGALFPLCPVSDLLGLNPSSFPLSEQVFSSLVSFRRGPFVSRLLFLWALVMRTGVTQVYSVSSMITVHIKGYFHVLKVDSLKRRIILLETCGK